MHFTAKNYLWPENETGYRLNRPPRGAEDVRRTGVVENLAAGSMPSTHLASTRTLLLLTPIVQSQGGFSGDSAKRSNASVFVGPHTTCPQPSPVTPAVVRLID